MLGLLDRAYLCGTITTKAVGPAAAGAGERVCLAVAGDEASDKEVVQGLIDSLGFDGLDAGSLSDSWRQQPGAPAYCRDLGRAALAAALAEADAAKVAQYRAEADEIARPYFAAPPA